MTSYDRLNCTICLDWLDVSKPVVATDCLHVFHEECFQRCIRSPENSDQEIFYCATCRRLQPETNRLFLSSAPFGQSENQKELDAAYKTIEGLEKERSNYEQLKKVIQELCGFEVMERALSEIDMLERGAELTDSLMRLAGPDDDELSFNESEYLSDGSEISDSNPAFPLRSDEPRSPLQDSQSSEFWDFADDGWFDRDQNFPDQAEVMAVFEDSFRQENESPASYALSEYSSNGSDSFNNSNLEEHRMDHDEPEAQSLNFSDDLNSMEPYAFMDCLLDQYRVPDDRREMYFSIALNTAGLDEDQRAWIKRMIEDNVSMLS